MKYTVISEYLMQDTFDSLEDARNSVHTSINKGTTSNQYILQIIEGYKIKVPVEVSVVSDKSLEALLIENKT